LLWEGKAPAEPAPPSSIARPTPTISLEIAVALEVLGMNSHWMDELEDDESRFEDDSLGAFYCPYTNGAECALLSKEWRPQELCEALECDQLKLFHLSRRRDKAA